MALSSFPLNSETATIALCLLSDKNTYKNPSYIPYLICICEGLQTNTEREQFIQLSQNKEINDGQKKEILLIASFWTNNS